MRRAVAAVGLVLLLAGGGCLGGDPEPTRVGGSPATLDPGAAAEAGYERVGLTNRTVNATITVTLQGDIQGRESQDVVATVPVAAYRRSRGSAPPAVLSVASSPSMEIVENPSQSGDALSTLSIGELVSFAQSAYANPADLREESTRTVTALGTEAELTTYRGTATYDGSTVEVAVQVARVPHDGDVVTVVAVHPPSSDASRRVADLLGSLRH